MRRPGAPTRWFITPCEVATHSRTHYGNRTEREGFGPPFFVGAPSMTDSLEVEVLHPARWRRRRSGAQGRRHEAESENPAPVPGVQAASSSAPASDTAAGATPIVERLPKRARQPSKLRAHDVSTAMPADCAKPPARPIRVVVPTKGPLDSHASTTSSVPSCFPLPQRPGGLDARQVVPCRCAPVLRSLHRSGGDPEGDRYGLEGGRFRPECPDRSARRRPRRGVGEVSPSSVETTSQDRSTTHILGT